MSSSLLGASVSSLYGALRLRSGQAPNKEKGSHGITLDFTLGLHRYPEVFDLVFTRKLRSLSQGAALPLSYPGISCQDKDFKNSLPNPDFKRFSSSLALNLD